MKKGPEIALRAGVHGLHGVCCRAVFAAGYACSGRRLAGAGVRQIAGCSAADVTACAASFAGAVFAGGMPCDGRPTGVRLAGAGVRGRGLNANAADVTACDGSRAEFRERPARVDMFVDLWMGKNPEFPGEPVRVGK